MKQNEKKELVPPWEKFPTYERYTIGWRMGIGEDYRYQWYDFLKTFSDYDSRLQYLKRHRPAPMNWANSVWNTLHPESEVDGFGCEDSKVNELFELGLIKHDVAYETWLLGQEDIVWPWNLTDSPIHAARYFTRDFWFSSRQMKTAREKDDFHLPEIPEDWAMLQSEFSAAKLGKMDTSKGLFTLAQMLCAGSILPPWELNLGIEDFADSFEMDMGYIDAYRLWIMCAFDDDQMLRKILAQKSIPSQWQTWLDEHIHF